MNVAHTVTVYELISSLGEVVVSSPVFDGPEWLPLNHTCISGVGTCLLVRLGARSAG